MKKSMIPLSERIRPKTIDEFVGQEHLLGKGKILRHMIDVKELYSITFAFACQELFFAPLKCSHSITSFFSCQDFS